MSSLVLPCLGLAPDAHPLAATPGQMRIADNVVCDLPGLVRARPNFGPHSTKATTYVPTSMHIFGSTPIMVSKDGSNYRLESPWAVITGNAEPVDFDEAETSFAEARKSLYYCTSTGVRALRTEAGTTTDAAGMRAPTITPGVSAFRVNPGYPGPHTGPISAAYVAVRKRTDVNGVVRRSPPTTRWVMRFATAVGPYGIVVGATSAAERWYFASGDLVAGDEVEIYRTDTISNITGTLAADAYLLATYTVTSTDVSNGYLFNTTGLLLDITSNDNLGEALYTNPQREGALAAKAEPPIASHVALWSSCLWYGRTKTRHRVVLDLRDVGSAASANPTSQSFGVRSTTGDVAVGTNTILNVASVEGVVVGDYVTDGGNVFTNPSTTNIPNATTVTVIAGVGPYTVTMSANATGTAAGTTIRFCNKLVVDGDPVAGKVGANTSDLGATGLAGGRSFVVSDATNDADRSEASASELARVVNALATYGEGTVIAYHSVGGQVILERTTLAGGAFTVTSTKPQAFAPDLGTGVTSTQEDTPNRIYYSLPDEPEAVPLLNYFDVGSERAPIQKLVPMKEALLVFKEDGVYRITGSYPRWSVDCIDETLRLVRPEAVAVLNGIAYAWTNRGVVEVDEGGVRRSISNGKIDTELFAVQGAIFNDNAYHGARVLTSERHNLVLLTVPTTSYGSPIYYSWDVYCYAIKTGLWTKWPELFIRCGASSSTGLLYTANNNIRDEMEWEVRSLLDNPIGYDRTYSGLSWTDTASSVNMSITDGQRGTWVPKAGDWVWWTIGGQVYWHRIITANANGGGYDIVLDSAARSDIGSATLRGAVDATPVVLEWLPAAMGTGGVSLGVWRELTFQMMGEAQAKVSPTDFRVTVGARHDGSATVASITATPARSAVVMRPYRVGWPRQGGRRPIVFPRLSWSEIDWPWRLAGIALVGETGSERVRK